MSISLQSANLNSRLVAPLTHFDRGSTILAGGKGANLGELIKGGFQVPRGFVITTAAYDLLIQATGQQVGIQEMLGSLQIDNSTSVTPMSQKMHTLFRSASIPVPVVDEILKAYNQLGSTAVAVRSSATAEDLPEAAFAGQQET